MEEIKDLKTILSEKWIVQENMENHGGSFVKHLGTALVYADIPNTLKIRETFSEYWETYLNFEKIN